MTASDPSIVDGVRSDAPPPETTPLDTTPTDPTATDPSPEDPSAPSEDTGDPEASDDATEPIVRQLPDVVLAIDIGGTKFAAGLVNAKGELIDRARVEVERDVVPEAHYTSLAGMVTEMMDRARDQHQVRIRAVGVGAAGPVGRGLVTVSPINIPAWRRFPLRARLEETTHLPVYGDLDAKALALAEGWLGAAQGHPNFCALTVSTGVGGGVVLDGELLDGATGNAGHIGHVIVEPGGRRCGCGAQGCLEAEASGLAIEAITGRPPSEPTYEIMQRTGRLVGLAAASVCNALDLSLVVVGGSVALGFAATFFHSAQVTLDEHVKLSYSRGARITPSRLADSGPVIGAGAVAWRGVRRARRLGRPPSGESA
ncbi:ROK family protein [Ilumatobacter nonamiensis]|uniref:ROK family protein n=1 Tax=Ilumatobacter nonamiensis TaxID=467093 RepID=UPI00034CF9F3|nr:ROK family protein [Ilumatobacter nonamiensis]